MTHLYIVRGLPGSGKSTFAKTLQIPHFESDQYRYKMVSIYLTLQIAHAMTSVLTMFLKVCQMDMIL
jgi:predicted kinase